MSFHESMRYQYDLTPDSVVIDLGCYEGDFAACIHEKYGCKVIAFEPVPQFFLKCHQRFENTDRVAVHNFAVGGENGDVEGKIKGNMSGLYADQGDAWRCRMIRMGDVLWMIGMHWPESQRVCLLKINTEGSEFGILEDMVSRGIMSLFDNIQVQFHDVAPDCHRRFDQLQKRLAETHELTFDAQWIWQNWRLKA